MKQDTVGWLAFIPGIVFSACVNAQPAKKTLRVAVTGQSDLFSAERHRRLQGHRRERPSLTARRIVKRCIENV
jgi:hypothetical protein